MTVFKHGSKMQDILGTSILGLVSCLGAVDAREVLQTQNPGVPNELACCSGN